MTKIFSNKSQLNRWLSLLLFFFISGFFIGTIDLSWAQDRQVQIQVNSKLISFDVQPYIDGNNRTMVPLRFVAEELGGEVTWNEGASEVGIVQNGKVIKLKINSQVAYVDNKTVALDTVPIIKDSRTMVPLRFISEGLGAKVEWDSQQYIVGISFEVSATTPISGFAAVITPPNGTSNVNIRSGPSTNFEILDRFPPGTILAVVGVGNDGKWHQVSLPNQKLGWVSSDLIVLRNTTDPSRGDHSSRDDYAPGSSDTSEPNTVLGVNINQINDLQVLTIEGQSDIKFSTLRLDNPRRLVIDIEKAVIPPELADKATIQVNVEPISQIRLSQFTSDAVRIVVDMTDIYTFTTASADNGKILSFNINKGDNLLNGKTIVIDPGHGSIQPGGWLDPGAVGPTGLHERIVALGISEKLGQILEGKGATVIFTHKGSTSLTLADRAKVATDNNADIFVSIHANANINRNIAGTMTFYHNSGSNAPSSKQLASAIQNDLVKKINRRDIGIDSANFAVLTNSTVPAVLVETAFISNYEEEKLLASDSFRQQSAEGIANGIIAYFAR
ncbi:MAG: N-acetylmuramoyl-L-alanine amidase [Bacillota bacterium]|nr:N-acetylmuramoyl-L-alanine amidase [Bacillota bacterium]